MTVRSPTPPTFPRPLRSARRDAASQAWVTQAAAASKRPLAPPPNRPPLQHERPAGDAPPAAKRPRAAMPLLDSAPATARTGLPQRSARHNRRPVALAGGEDWGEEEDDEDWGGGSGGESSSGGSLDGDVTDDDHPRPPPRRAAPPAAPPAAAQAAAPRPIPAAAPPAPAPAPAAGGRGRKSNPYGAAAGDDSDDDDFEITDDSDEEDEIIEEDERPRGGRKRAPRGGGAAGGRGRGRAAATAAAVAGEAGADAGTAAGGGGGGRGAGRRKQQAPPVGGLPHVAGSFVARGSPAAVAAAAATAAAAPATAPSAGAAAARGGPDAEAEEDGVGRGAARQDRWLAQAGMVLRDPPAQHLLAAAAVGRLHRCVDERALPRADLALTLMLQLLQLGADARRQLRDRRYAMPPPPERQLADLWPQVVDILAESALDPAPGDEERERAHGSDEGWAELAAGYKADEVVRKVVQVRGHKGARWRRDGGRGAEQGGEGALPGAGAAAAAAAGLPVVQVAMATWAVRERGFLRLPPCAHHPTRAPCADADPGPPREPRPRDRPPAAGAHAPVRPLGLPQRGAGVRALCLLPRRWAAPGG